MSPDSINSSAVDSIGNILQNRVKYAEYFEDTGKSDMSIDTFYQLLIAEMSNQDPMDPMSNTEFISQMAAFTSLQVQQEALYYNNSNYAQSLAGKTVVVAQSTGKGLDVKTGVVSSVNFTGGEFKVKVEDKEYPIKNIMEVLDRGSVFTNSLPAAQGSDGAFATSLIGKFVTVGMVNNAGVPIVDDGIVQRVEIKDGQMSVVINDKAYPLYSVAKVEPPEAAEKPAEKADASVPGGVKESTGE